MRGIIWISSSSAGTFVRTIRFLFSPTPLFRRPGRRKICSIHLPLPVLEANAGLLSDFQAVGTSVHSLDEARRAAALGANYMTAGHIFNTQCKAGLPGRGLDFLSLICKESPVPVFAIGGITPENMPDILKAGAAGGCMMSSLMTAENPESLISP